MTKIHVSELSFRNEIDDLTDEEMQTICGGVKIQIPPENPFLGVRVDVDPAIAAQLSMFANGLVRDVQDVALSEMWLKNAVNAIIL